MTGVDRAELRAVVRDLLDDLSASAQVRAVAESEARFDERLWRQLTEVGWAGMEAPDALGGGGASFGDAAVVLTELGRHLTVSPLASTMVLGLGALLLAGSAEQRAAWVPRLCDGSARGTAALAGGGELRPDGDGWLLSGTWTHVPDADLADFVVVTAPELVLVPAAALEVTPTPMLDLTRRLCRVVATGVRLGPEALLAAGAVPALADRAALATACDALGVAERALAMTVDYARTRVQFGRPIGSFQAVKHQCTDMLVAVETARIAVDAALDAYDADPSTAALAVSMAKAHTCEAATRVCADAVTLHGGIGYTWEHDCHLMLKRARLDEALYGGTRHHRRRTADLVLA